MNEKTAKHLNRLLAQAQPITYTLDQGFSGPEAALKAVIPAMQAIVDGMVWLVTAAEIRDAAFERREASVAHVRWADSVHWARRPCPTEWSFTRRLWTAAGPQIQALLDADNARRVAEYEAYRAACEQGVAVPPSE